MPSKILAALAAAILAFVVFAPSAGATSLSTVSRGVDRITADLTDVGAASSDYDMVAISDACAALSVDAGIATTYHRPRAFPKAAWRHAMNSWMKLSTAGDLCQEGADNYDADLIGEASDMMDSASTEANLAANLM